MGAKKLTKSLEKSNNHLLKTIFSQFKTNASLALMHSYRYFKQNSQVSLLGLSYSDCINLLHNLFSLFLVHFTYSENTCSKRVYWLTCNVCFTDYISNNKKPIITRVLSLLLNYNYSCENVRTVVILQSLVCLIHLQFLIITLSFTEMKLKTSSTH